MKLVDIKKNSQNPRIIKDVQFDRLCNSVIEFPKMLLKRKIAIAEGTILGGNQRYEVLKYIKRIGKQQVIDKLTEKDFNVKQIDDNLKILENLFNDRIDDYVIDCSDMTESEQKKFIVLDNNDFGEWDIDLLTALYDTDELLELGCEFPQFADIDNEINDINLDLIGDCKDNGEYILFMFNGMNKNKITDCKDKMGVPQNQKSIDGDVLINLLLG